MGTLNLTLNYAINTLRWGLGVMQGPPLSRPLCCHSLSQSRAALGYWQYPEAFCQAKFKGNSCCCLANSGKVVRCYLKILRIVDCTEFFGEGPPIFTCQAICILHAYLFRCI